MPEAAVVQKLDRPLAASLPSVLDKEAQDRTQFLAAEGILASHRREIHDHELRLRRDREPGLPRDGLGLLSHDVGVDALPARRNHQAFERALLVRCAEMGAFTPKGVAHHTLDRRVADDGILG